MKRQYSWGGWPATVVVLITILTTTVAPRADEPTTEAFDHSSGTIGPGAGPSMSYQGVVELRSTDGTWTTDDVELTIDGDAVAIDGSNGGRALRLALATPPASPAPVLELVLLEATGGVRHPVATATADATADHLGLAVDGFRARVSRVATASADLELLASWLAGSFTSAAPTEADPNTAAVDLHLAPIWQDRSDGPWRYLEQTLPDYPEHPYRQRVIELLEPTPGLVEIRFWTLPDPTAAVGAWRLDAPLPGLSPRDLDPRPGCAILVRRRDGVFEGSTVGTLCSSGLRGATYATSEIAVTADGLVSWDRGFAADGHQVWGHPDTGLVFDRVVPTTDAGGDTGSDDDGGEGSDSVVPVEPEPSPDSVLEDSYKHAKNAMITTCQTILPSTPGSGESASPDGLGLRST
jgi:CpeT protein